MYYACGEKFEKRGKFDIIVDSSITDGFGGEKCRTFYLIEHEEADLNNRRCFIHHG